MKKLTPLIGLLMLSCASAPVPAKIPNHAVNKNSGTLYVEPIPAELKSELQAEPAVELSTPEPKAELTTDQPSCDQVSWWSRIWSVCNGQ